MEALAPSEVEVEGQQDQLRHALLQSFCAELENVGDLFRTCLVRCSKSVVLHVGEFGDLCFVYRRADWQPSPVAPEDPEFFRAAFLFEGNEGSRLEGEKMVVIVIRVPTRDGNEDKPSSSVAYETGSGSRVTVSKKICEETGPPSYDSGVNIDAEPRDLKLFLRESRTRTEHDRESKDSGLGGYSEYNRLKDLELLREIHERSKNEIRLESPASKDSGFSDLKPRPSNVTTIKYSSPGTGPDRITYLSSRSSQPDTDSNTVTYFSCSSQADPENSIATTKEGKFSLYSSSVTGAGWFPELCSNGRTRAVADVEQISLYPLIQITHPPSACLWACWRP